MLMFGDCAVVSGLSLNSMTVDVHGRDGGSDGRVNVLLCFQGAEEDREAVSGDDPSLSDGCHAALYRVLVIETLENVPS